MIQSEELQSLLSQCTGTESYHRIVVPRLIFTDGVKLFTEKAEAMWFITDLAIYLKQPLFVDEYFLNITLDVDKERHSAFLSIDDGNGNELFNHFYNYTDCPAGKWQFYYVSDVLMLPSEY